MSEKKYFIVQYTQEKYLHGGVSGTDAEKVLSSLGFVPVLFPWHFSFSLKAKVSRFLFLLKMIFSIKRTSVVVFLFPVYARMNKLLLSLLRSKGSKLICLIMDIEGLRDTDKKLLKREISQLKKTRYFIVHNEKMKLFVEQFVPGSICSILNFFDYLVSPAESKKQKAYDIVFAGNLQKSKFLSGLDQLAETNLHFNIYGPDIPGGASHHKNITYYGAYSPDNMPLIIKGSFGLIWDGDDIDRCSGGYGEYLRYNSQHKLSLYILSGLPVIVWEEAATAQLVKEHEIGFTIKNLDEIEIKIKSLTDEEYRQMQINMLPLAKKISRGECLANALDEIIQKMQA